MEPLNDGGCPLYGYSILRDDGASSSFVEVHALQVNGNPSLDDFTVTDLPPSPTGLTVKFKIVAYNKAGYSVTSKSTSIVIASTPDAPLTSPQSDFAQTNA